MNATRMIAIWICTLATPWWAVGGTGGWFPVPENQAAWECLPKTSNGSRDAVLPVWARVLARPLPSTTAALLELDYVQRAENPLDPQLRAKIRYIAAQANGSKYASACARADLIRAGGDAQELERIWSSPPDQSEKERRTFAFANNLCVAAYEVTDAEVEKLLNDWGPADLCAIVLTVAYANFQDRLLISLGVESEEGEWLAPPAVKFDWESLKDKPLNVPTRRSPEPPPNETVPITVDDPDWQSAPLAELQQKLRSQQLRSPRIPIPPDDLVERQIPPGTYPPGKGSTIRWNSVGYGYQPELTHAWFFAMRRFREESKLADDFRQTVFWVVTRANMCFY